MRDAREAEAAAAALAKRSRIAGNSTTCSRTPSLALAIQLQGARKLADRESASGALRGALERSAGLAKEGLADARQAVGALRGDRLPTVDQVGALVEDFRRDTGAEATLPHRRTPRPLPADVSLALFRGAQEALTNITRYAPGTSVAVTVRYAPGRTILAVEDQLRAVAGAGSAGGPRGRRRPRARPSTRREPAAGRRRRRARPHRDAGAGNPGGRQRAGRPTADGWLVEWRSPGDHRPAGPDSAPRSPTISA